MVATTVCMINMMGGVGKTTLSFNLAWYAAWKADLKVLAVDLDPQANLSQMFMGAEGYLQHLESRAGTVVEILERYSSPSAQTPSPTPVDEAGVIRKT